MPCNKIGLNFKTVKIVTETPILKERNGAELAAFFWSGREYIAHAAHASFESAPDVSMWVAGIYHGIICQCGLYIIIDTLIPVSNF